MDFTATEATRLEQRTSVLDLACCWGAGVSYSYRGPFISSYECITDGGSGDSTEEQGWKLLDAAMWPEQILARVHANSDGLSSGMALIERMDMSFPGL